MLNRLRHHLQSISLEQFQAEWAEIEAMGFDGPTVEEFLKSLRLTPTFSELKVIESIVSSVGGQYKEGISISSFVLAA